MSRIGLCPFFYFYFGSLILISQRSHCSLSLSLTLHGSTDSSCQDDTCNFLACRYLVFFLISGSSSCAAPVHGLHTQQLSQGSSLSARATDKLVTREDIWDKFVRKGREMQCAMNGDQNAADEAVGGRSAT